MLLSTSVLRGKPGLARYCYRPHTAEQAPIFPDTARLHPLFRFRCADFARDRSGGCDRATRAIPVCSFVISEATYQGKGWGSWNMPAFRTPGCVGHLSRCAYNAKGKSCSEEKILHSFDNRKEGGEFSRGFDSMICSHNLPLPPNCRCRHFSTSSLVVSDVKKVTNIDARWASIQTMSGAQRYSA